MISGNPEDYEPWPEMNRSRLLDMYPESELVKIYALPNNSVERKSAWEALGVVDPIKQQACEVELDNLIKSLEKKKSTIKTSSPSLDLQSILDAGLGISFDIIDWSI